MGLITADEVAYAGGVTNIANTSFYLHTGQNYWTMTPSYYLDDVFGARVFQLYFSIDLVFIFFISEYFGKNKNLSVKQFFEFILFIERSLFILHV